VGSLTTELSHCNLFMVNYLCCSQILLSVLRYAGAAVRLCLAWNPIPFRIAHYEKLCRKKKFAEGQAKDNSGKSSKKEKLGTKG